jgi:sugar lactone lactonase YvrE
MLRLRTIKLLVGMLTVASFLAGMVPSVRAQDYFLLVASNDNSSILRYNGRTGVFLDALVPSGSGGLDSPDVLRFGPDGRLYANSFFNHAVMRYDAFTGQPLPSAGNPGAQFVASGSGGLRQTEGLAFAPNGNLLVAPNRGSDNTNRQTAIKEYSGTTGAYVRDFVPEGSGGLGSGNDLHFGPDGSLYVTAYAFAKLLRYDGVTGAPKPAPGRTDANFVDPAAHGLELANGFAFGPDGNLYLATDHRNGSPSSILKYNGTTGDFISEFVAAGSGGLDFADGVVFGPDGNLYVTNSDINGPGPNNVLRFDGRTGAFLDAFIPSGSGGLLNPGGLLFQAVPEPSTWTLLALGSLGLLSYAWRRRRAA